MVVAGYSCSTTHDLIQGTPLININQLSDSLLPQAAKLNSTKVANPFYGTSAGVLNLAWRQRLTQLQLSLPYPGIRHYFAAEFQPGPTPVTTRCSFMLAEESRPRREHPLHHHLVAQ